MASEHDSLRSKQNIRVLYAVSEGEIEEINTIYLNENNIKSVYGDFAYTLGSTTQKQIPYFETVGGTTTPTTALKMYDIEPTNFANYFLVTDANTTVFPNDGTLSAGVTPAAFSYDVEFVRIYFAFNSFYAHDGSNGDYRSTPFEAIVLSGKAGNLQQRKLSYNHSTITSGHVIKNGKSMGAYTLVVDVPRPSEVVAGEDWLITVLRRAYDAKDGTEGQNYWSTACNLSFQEYFNSEKTTYAGTALVAIAVEDASRVNNSFPSFAAKGKGLKLKVPIASYYNAATRTTLTSTWNGKFEPTLTYTNNYAWCLYNIVSDSLTKYIPIVEAPTTTITDANFFNEYEKVVIGCGVPEEYMAKYNFNSFANYCDEEVKVTSNTLNYITSITYSAGSVTITTSRAHNLTTANVLIVKGVGTEWDTPDITSYDAITSVPTTTTLTFARTINVLTKNPASQWKVYYSATEKRYSLNGQFIERKDAESFLNDILTIGNCYLAEIDGLVNVIYDRPLTLTEIDETPLFTNQNVDNGIFEYSDSNIADNYTQINVTIQDKDNFNRTKTVSVFANDLKEYLNSNSLLPYYETIITAGNLPINYFENKFELNIFDITMQGTTSTGAAYRKGRTLLWDALMNNEIVSFRTLIAGSNLYKGQIIRIADVDLMNSTGITTGRLISCNTTTNTLTFDRDITFALNTTYTLYLYLQNSPNVETILDISPKTNVDLSAIAVLQQVGDTFASFSITENTLFGGDIVDIVCIAQNSFSKAKVQLTYIATVNGKDTFHYELGTTTLVQLTSTIEITKTTYFIQKKPSKFTYNNGALLTTNTLQLNALSNTDIIADSIFVIKDNSIQTYKVISTTKEDDMYTTSCVRYDLNKFAYADYPIINNTSLAHYTYKAPDFTSNIDNTIVDIYATITGNTSGNLTANMSIVWSDTASVDNEFLPVYAIEWHTDTNETGSGIVRGSRTFNFPVNIATDASIITFTFKLQYVSEFIANINIPVTSPAITFTWDLDVPATISSTMIEN